MQADALFGEHRAQLAADELLDLHRQYRATGDAALRDELVRQYRRLPLSMASRLADRGHDGDDLRQTAMIGLLNALERYDPERGVTFSTFAWATISGELKRHFRDATWGVRVSRPLQERYLAVSRAIDGLATGLGRSPTMAEVADAAGITIDEVAEAIELQHARTVASLDAPAPGDFGPIDLPAAGDDIGSAESRLLLVGLLRRLPRREQRVIWLRFGCQMSQSQIAAQVGVSQMQVSRLLARSLATLRAAAAEAGPDEDQSLSA